MDKINVSDRPKGKIIIITRGASGIGLAWLLQRDLYLREGACAFIIDHNKKKNLLKLCQI